jgi:hypothetical protein
LSILLLVARLQIDLLKVEIVGLPLDDWNARSLLELRLHVVWLGRQRVEEPAGAVSLFA